MFDCLIILRYGKLIGSRSLIRIHDAFGKRMVSIRGADDILFTDAGMRHIPGGFGEGRYGEK